MPQTRFLILTPSYPSEFGSSSFLSPCARIAETLISQPLMSSCRAGLMLFSIINERLEGTHFVAMEDLLSRHAICYARNDNNQT
jgi:hypothetical protein